MKRILFSALASLIVVMTIFAIACDSYDKERHTVNDQQEVYLKAQPVPRYDWSPPRQILTEIYNAQMHSVRMFAYQQSPYSQKIMFECACLGYPIPADTQLTNPEQRTGSGTIKQPEPNGLYSSSATHGTWVPCIGESGKIEPVYIEGDVSAFPRPMQEVSGKLIPAGKEPATLVIDIKR